MGRRKKNKTVNWKKRADENWSLAIRLLHQKCEICGKPGTFLKSGYKIGGLNAHHLIGRSHYKFRHDLNNGVCLCVHCHHFRKDLSPHAGSIIGVTNFIEWMAKNKPAQWAWFLHYKDSPKGKPDLTYEEIFVFLQYAIDNGFVPDYNTDY